ncbi:MAG: GspH/FimT family pseudopilin [Betaproteobacteria bacterium]
MLTRSIQRGFTLIELAITIVVTALLVTLAVPSFKIMLANAQIRTATQALYDGLQLARVEAIRRNERMLFTKGAGSDWTVTVEVIGTVVQTRSSSEGTRQATVAVTPNGAAQVTFDALGRVVANTDGSASITTLDIDVPPTLIAAADSKEQRVTITTGGAVRTCDPNASAGTGTSCL